jgi:hypothetical protein
MRILLFFNLDAQIFVKLKSFFCIIFICIIRIIKLTKMNSDKKIVVKKTIPRKTMGYLKFALSVLGSNEENIIQKLFLDKSIDEIISSVNDVVENGDQAKTINDLRKQIINPSKVKKPRAQTKTKIDDNDDDRPTPTWVLPPAGTICS